jgi:recombination protein RecR
MADAHAIDALRQALRRLPGVGPRTAQRMAFHLLERDREGARQLAHALHHALSRVLHCRRCNNFSETELCAICSSPRRDASLLCVVETPADLEAVELASAYEGMYFVLMGHLSPLDGIGPEQLGIRRLIETLDGHDIREVILATNLTVEGEATNDYIGELLADRGITVTRLARGVPVGGELEYLDHATLSQAFRDRRAL